MINGAAVFKVGVFRLLDRLEERFVHTANRAYPVIGQILESRAWLDAVIRIAVCRIIFIAARDTNPFLHKSISWKGYG